MMGGRADPFERLDRPRRTTVGRDRLLVDLTSHLSKPGRKILVCGAAGIGKTHLARAVLTRLAAVGADTEEIVGGTTASRVPLGPAAHLVPSLSGDVPLAGLIASTLDVLGRRAADRPLILLADDVDLLDDASATLVGHLATTEGVSLVGTSREAVSALQPFAAMAKDGALASVALTTLGPAETAELAALHAGDRLDPESGLRVYDMTRGNPLFVTQLIRAATTRGALSVRPGGLHLDTAIAMGGLDRLLSERIDTVTQPEARALNLIAAAGPLPLSLLEKAADPASLNMLSKAGLLDMDTQPDPVVRFSHPLYREIVRSRLKAIETRSLLRDLLDIMGPAPDPARVTSDDDRVLLVRLGLWHAELGIPFDPSALGWAAREVHWGLLEVIRRHLSGQAADANVALAGGLDRVDERSDAAYVLASELWKSDRTFINGARLARIVNNSPDRAEEMLSVIGSMESLASNDQQRATLAMIHGIWLFWIARDRAGAAALLERAQAGIGLPWRLTLISTQAGLGVHSGDIAKSLQALQEAAPPEDAPDIVNVLNWSPLSAALINSGRLKEGVELARTALPLSMSIDDELGRDQGMRAMEELTIVDHWGRLCLGRYDEVASGARSVSDLLEGTDQDEGRALFIGLEARCRFMQAKPATAEKMLAEAVRRHGPFSMLGFRPMLHGSRAIALAWLGRLAEAEVEAKEAARWHDPPRFIDAEVTLAQATVDAATGHRSRAVTVSMDTAHDAADRGIWLYAFQASFLAAKLSPEPAQLDLLNQSADRIDGEYPRLARAYCSALASGDPIRLEEVGRLAFDQGETLLALEILAAAVECATGARRARLEGALSRLSEDCERATSPFTLGLAGTTSLTEREFEIVTLAARGWSSPAIAAELVLSVRTVESHLYRAFSKLGVHSRTELAQRFEGGLNLNG